VAAALADSSTVGAASPAPTLAISQFTTMPQRFADDLACYGRQGVSALELCERKLAATRDEALAELALVDEHGLVVSSVQPRTHALFPDGMSPAPAALSERVQQFHASIDLIADAFPGCCTPLVSIGGAAPAQDIRAAWSSARSAYGELATHAHERGLRIAFEPLHPVLMNLDSFICTLDGALELIAAVDHPAFGLTLDVWHLFWEAQIQQRIASMDGARIFVVHVGDWPCGGPRAIADRVLPGQGVIDLPGMLAAIHQSGYRGAYTVELFSERRFADSLWRRDLDELVRAARAGFHAAWEVAHAAAR